MRRWFDEAIARTRAGAFTVAALAMLAAAATAAAHDLPVGDGHVSDHPSIGDVYACQQDFRGGGARHVGDWFHGDTWDPLAKPHVAGRVMWPQATQTLQVAGDAVSVQGNGLPVGQPTGIFPIATSDPVYQYDTNPNPIQAQTLSFKIPSKPVRAAQASCLPMGMIGFTVTGVALYSALDDAGRDAAAHEVQDLCDGHPQGKGQYHYHSSSPCLPGAEGDAVVGWALDGYPILGMRDAKGALLKDRDLDGCHGRAEAVDIDGRHYDYAYRMTQEYPYIMGCFSGQVLPQTRQAIRASMGPPRPRGRRGMPPPPDAQGTRPDH